MDTRAEFRGLVGLDLLEDSTPRNPSDALRRMWFKVADTYDVQQLRGLFQYNGYQMREYRKQIGAPRPVLRAWQNLLVQLCAFTGVVPDGEWTQVLAPHVAAVQSPSWTGLQDAIAALADAWEEIGL